MTEQRKGASITACPFLAFERKSRLVEEKLVHTISKRGVKHMDEKKNCKKKKEQTPQEPKEELQESYELGVKYMEELEEKEENSEK